MSTFIQTLKKGNDEILPRTVTSAVLDSNNNNLDTILAGKADVSSLTNKEDKSNKVTSLSASSTNTQYPSAKCVYDIVGNIETLLYNINSGGA